MKDDITQKISSAYQASEFFKQQARETDALEKKAKDSSIKFETLLKEQTDLLREANERAATSEEKAENSEREARMAKRHAVLANIIAVIALAFAVFQYLAGS